MATTERLLDFPVKTSPTPADIVYLGDAANSFNEVQSTIAQIIGAYPGLLSIGGLTTAANKMIYATASNVYATADLTAFARTLLDDADATAARVTLGLVIGTNVQAFNAALASIAGLTTAANNLIYTTASNTYATIAAAANSVLATDGSNVPSLTATLPTAVQSNITQLGTQGAALNMGSHLINNVSNPVSAQDAANKAYVDSVAQGITVQGACRAATTGALTVTYSNGTSGVGATVTNAGAQAALVIDGVTLAVSDRVLIKNQASTLQNGIYTVTDIGSVSTNWVMTRATDYDQAAEINPGDLVLITAGTANTNSSWIETATVVTVGTDPISFSQFSASLPISLSNGGTGASLVASNGGIFYSTGSAGAILSGTATAGQLLLSGSSAAPSWSTATFASTYTASNLLYSNGANTVTGLATANSSVLTTDGSGVPSWVALLPVALGGTGVAASKPVIQIAFSQTGAVATGSTVVPLDDTIPQNTEGDQYLTVSFTPKSAANIVEVTAVFQGANSAVNPILIGSIFQDSGANALNTGWVQAFGTNAPVQLNVFYRGVVGTASSTTFNFRVGAQLAGTTTISGASGGRLFGSALNSYILVKEYAP